MARNARATYLQPVGTADGRPSIRRVLGYARVSSAEQSHGTSLADQERAIRSYAASRGVDVARMYVEAVSGAYEKIERRLQMHALLADVQAGDLVVCDKLDRWSRDRVFTLDSVRTILQRGASFYAVAEAMDPSTHDGNLMLGFRAVLAHEDRERIRERMVGTRKLLRDRGLYAEGLPPFGYRRSLPKGERGPERKNVLRAEEREADTVRAVFRLCIAGRSLAKIAAEVGLTRDRVVGILGCRVYVGEVQDSLGRWIKGAHPAIVDAETFTRAQDALAARRLGGARPRSTPAETSGWILRDVATCAHCGARMGAAYAGPREARRYYYRCTHRCTTRFVAVRAVEAEAAPLVVARLADLRDELTREPEHEPARVAPDFAARRERQRKKREKYLEMYAEETISREELRAAMGKLDAEALRIDADEQASKRTSPLDDPAARRAALGNVRAIGKAWAHATPEERREIVGLLATSVRLAAGSPPVFAWRTAEELAERT